MFRIFLGLLIASFVTFAQEKKKFHIYIFLLDHKEILDESLKSFAPKVFCPKGNILDKIGYKSKENSVGGTVFYAQIDCNGAIGYIEYDEDTLQRPTKEWLIQHRKKLLSLYEYGKEYSGAYTNPKSWSMLMIPSTQDSEKFQVKLILESAVRGSDSAVFRFDQWKISNNICELSNTFVKLILKKEGKGFHLKVIKDNKYHLKDFDNTYWEPNTDPERRN